MQNNDSHLSDQELLLVADGELPSRRVALARAHLAACWTCRTRMGEIEGTVADFVRLYHNRADSEAGPAAGWRALLKSRLARLVANDKGSIWPTWLNSTLAGRVVACLVAVLICATWIYEIHRQAPSSGIRSRFALRGDSPVPNHSLTPGATLPVTTSDVCTVRRREAQHQIPISLQRKVFEEYGMPDARPTDYELDHLITPDLGGSDDLRNLWPESHSATIWNSYVKDALEDRLYQMVCEGSLDLPTAQHDIATDWIAAYKKYFNTDRPLSDQSRSASASRRGRNG
jgi:hypothetical protein